MMKARSYNRRALTQTISNNLSVIEESNSIERFTFDGITNDKEQNKIGEYLVNAYKDAKEIGTLQTIEEYDYNSFKKYLLSLEKNVSRYDIFSSAWLMSVVPFMLQLTKQAIIMSKKYAVVCTNPPYMNKLEGPLKKFVVDHYKPYSSDLFSVFMYRNFDFCKKNGYSAFMTPNVWMFIKSYEKLREYIINSKSIDSLVQMAKGAFYKEATVDICAFVLRNDSLCKYGTYIRLDKFKGDMEVQRMAFLKELELSSNNIFIKRIDEFKDIEGFPIAYWISETTKSVFKSPINIGKISPPKQGLATANNDRFLRLWYEVDISKIGFGIGSVEEAAISEKNGSHTIKVELIEDGMETGSILLIGKMMALKLKTLKMKMVKCVLGPKIFNFTLNRLLLGQIQLVPIFQDVMQIKASFLMLKVLVDSQVNMI